MGGKRNLEKPSCKNCRNMNKEKKEVLDGRLKGKYRYGCGKRKNGYICGVLSDDEMLSLLVCESWNGTGKQEKELRKLAQEFDGILQELYDRWSLWKEQGAPVNEWTDGVCLNRIRRSMEQVLKQIERELPEEEYPENYYAPLPPLMDENYMAASSRIKDRASQALREYTGNLNYQWLAENIHRLKSNTKEYVEAHRLLYHVEILKRAIEEENFLDMKKESSLESLYDDLMRCRKQIQAKETAKKKDKGKGDKNQLIGQLSLSGLKVS